MNSSNAGVEPSSLKNTTQCNTTQCNTTQRDKAQVLPQKLLASHLLITVLSDFILLSVCALKHRFDYDIFIVLIFNIFVFQSFQFLFFPETSFIHSFIIHSWNPRKVQQTDWTPNLSPNYTQTHNTLTVSDEGFLNLGMTEWPKKSHIQES